MLFSTLSGSRSHFVNPSPLSNLVRSNLLSNQIVRMTLAVHRKAAVSQLIEVQTLMTAGFRSIKHKTGETRDASYVQLVRSKPD